MNYALHEALRLIHQEGLGNTFARHQNLGQALHKGLEAMGLELQVDEKYRLPQLTSVKVPKGVNEAEIRAQLLKNYPIEIGAGLGDLQGKIWRIGLMGYSANSKNVTLVLSALEELLSKYGANIERGVAVAAATDIMFNH